MDSLTYYGYGILDYMAWAYVCKNHQSGDGYAVIDTDGTPLLGLVVEGKPTHLLEVKPR